MIDRRTGAIRHRLPEAARGAVVAIDGGLRTWGETLQSWVLADETSLSVIPSPVGIGAAAWSEDGTRIALAGGDGSVSVWPVTTAGRPSRHSWQSSVVKGLTTLDNDFVAVVTADGWVRRLVDGVSPPAIVASDHPDGLRRVGRVGDNLWTLPYIAAPSFIEAGSPPRSLPLPRGLDGQDAPDRQSAAILTEEGVWRMFPTGEVRRMSLELPPDAGAVAVSNNGRVALVADGAVRVYDADDRLVVAIPVDGTVQDVAFSASGALAIGTRDGRVAVWVDVGPTSSEPWFSLRGHQDRVAWVGFSPDGRHLASASWDGTARVWSMP